LRAAALSAPIEAGEEVDFEDGGEEEREVSIVYLGMTCQSDLVCKIALPTFIVELQHDLYISERIQI
jgi:hypothetical protein